MPRQIKDKEYFFITTYSKGLHVGGAICYRGKLKEVDKIRRKEGNFFDREEDAEKMLKIIKKLLISVK